MENGTGKVDEKALLDQGEQFTVRQIPQQEGPLVRPHQSLQIMFAEHSARCGAVAMQDQRVRREQTPPTELPGSPGEVRVFAVGREKKRIKAPEDPNLLHIVKAGPSPCPENGNGSRVFIGVFCLGVHFIMEVMDFSPSEGTPGQPCLLPSYTFFLDDLGGDGEDILPIKATEKGFQEILFHHHVIVQQQNMGAAHTLESDIVGRAKAAIAIQGDDLDLGPFVIEPAHRPVIRPVVHHNDLVFALDPVQGLSKGGQADFEKMFSIPADDQDGNVPWRLTARDGLALGRDPRRDFAQSEFAPDIGSEERP